MDKITKLIRTLKIVDLCLSTCYHAASTWEDCFWSCIKDIQYCVSFTFASNGAIKSDQVCIIVKSNSTAIGIWSGVSDATENFVLYDETCPVPVVTTPVKKSSTQYGITSSSLGGPTLEVYKTRLLSTFNAASLAECKAICDRFDGCCASYSYNAYSKPRNCIIMEVAIEDLGTYENMGDDVYS